ncbi:MAG: efflux RND transporter periplasmic adaptor subunit [Akkermansiaceae bacterium]
MKHIIALTAFSALAALSQGVALADEHTVEEKPFKAETSLNAIFLPTKSQPISIAPKVWTDFTITSLVSQGAVVKKGDTLIGIDTEAADKYLAATEKARATAELNLAQAKHELAQLEITTPRSLAAYERAEKEAAENLQWYTNIGHAKEIEETKRSVKRAELMLAYQMEELKQLEKMYGEDNKTEETEEIILIRTRNSVDRAKFSLKSAKIEADAALKTYIPRKLKNMQLTAESAKIANAGAKEKLPRDLKLKQIAVAKAAKDDAEAVTKLAKAKADRAMMNITAPENGRVYYGSMENGRWSTATALKVLKVGGKLPAHTTLMTFIPAGATLQLSSFIGENQLAQVSEGDKGFAITHLNRYRQIAATASSVATHPEADGTYRVTLTTTATKNLTIVPGMKATVKITSTDLPKALLVPASYLGTSNDGKHTVKVKQADGKTATRPVEIGAYNADTVVITKGLNKGQVIVK